MNQVDRSARGDERAFENPGLHLDKAAINFLIRLSETDPVALVSAERPGDLPNLIADLFRFRLLLPATDIKTAVSRLTDSLRADPGLLRHVPALVRKLLAATADKQHFEWKLRPGSKVIFEGAVAATSPGRMILFTPEGRRDFEQVIVFGAMLFLYREDGEMVRRCAREVCGRIFLATRPKQIFCGRRCASAAAFERYKQGIGEEAYKEKHRKAARHSWQVKRRRRADQTKMSSTKKAKGEDS
jgi:hypothetical protein